ncbi:hypothetical protein RCL1_003902 [Eukaryota sp. TZLM3-RCL]
MSEISSSYVPKPNSIPANILLILQEIGPATKEQIFVSATAKNPEFKKTQLSNLKQLLIPRGLVSLEEKLPIKDSVFHLTQAGIQAVQALLNPVAKKVKIIKKSTSPVLSVVLLVDHREKIIRKSGLALLEREGIRCESTRLLVGDFMWKIVSSKGDEFCLPFVMERKTIDDMRHSVMNNRLSCQRDRMVQFRTASLRSHIQYNIICQVVSCEGDFANILVSLTKLIEQLKPTHLFEDTLETAVYWDSFRLQPVASVIGTKDQQIDPTVDVQNSSLSNFNSQLSSNESLWKHMLTAVPRLGATSVEGLVRHFPCAVALFNHVNRCLESGICPVTDLANMVVCEKTNRKLGPSKANLLIDSLGFK